MRDRYADMSTIPLTRSGIDAVLPTLTSGLGKYGWLQAELALRDVSDDREYQRRFNGFYRVRRNSAWQRCFFGLLQNGKAEKPSLSATLLALHGATGRVEASFASKLVATLDTSQPVIDSVVLRHLRLRLPQHGQPLDRIASIVAVHESIAYHFAEYLAAPIGRYLVTRFRGLYPHVAVTEIKILDLLLWRTRDAA